MAVERAVIEPLRLEEDHRVGILDRRDQQTLGVARIGRHDRLQAGDVGEQRFGALAVGLAAEDAAAGRHPDHHRAGEVAGRAIAQARGLGDDLVIGRVHVVGELDLDAGAQAIGRHADRGADDAELADRRVEAAVDAVFLLEAVGAAEDAAEIADILAIDDDIVVAAHGDVEGRADRLDHGHASHGQTPICWRWRRRCGGSSA
jgi:hypothetical protein